MSQTPTHLLVAQGAPMRPAAFRDIERSLPGEPVISELQSKISVSGLVTPRWLLPSLEQLRRESDTALFWQGMLATAQGLRSEGHDALAQETLSRVMENETSPPDLKAKAATELSAYQGGRFGPRAEFLLSRFSQSATDWRVIVPMLGAGLVGRLAGGAALGRLSGLAAEGRLPWYAQGLGARLTAGSAAYLAEVPAFTVMSRALAPTQGAAPFSEDLARSALSLGALKAFGALGNAGGRWLTPVGSRPGAQAALLSQTTTLLGLMSAHHLEARLGLRPHVEGSVLFLDSLAALFSLGVGVRLGHGVLGERYALLQRQLEILNQSRPRPPLPRWTRTLNSPPLVPALAGGIQIDLAGRPGQDPLRPWVFMSANSNDGGSGGKKGDSLVPMEVPNIIVDPAANTDPFVGQVLDGRYKIEAQLGFGGMGKVYLATHEILGKKMAIKVLREDIAASEEATTRFLTEAQAASAIGNPHIVDINDFGRLPDGSTYYAMEYLEGRPLSKLARDGETISIPTMIHVARQIAEGLGAAHQAGIVHRDLKPENIFLVQRGSERNFVKILDFGIAKMLRSNRRLTLEGRTMGTAQYMSPEQAFGAEIDPRSDIYAFGILLYEMASGKLPFNGANPMEIMRQQAVDDPIPLNEAATRKVPPEFEALVAKSMQKAPEDRYQSMEEVVRELDRLQAKFPRKLAANAEPTQIIARRPDAVPTQPRRRWPLFVGLGGASAGALAIAASVLATRQSAGISHDASPPAPDAAIAPPPDAASAIVDAAPPAPIKARVTLKVFPKDARVFLGSKELGKESITIEVELGTPVEVEIRRRGYKTKRLSLDGKETELTLRLEREAPVQAPRPPKPPKEEPPKGPGPGEVVSPWK